MTDRQPFDLRAYMHDIATRPCFICGLIDNDPACFHHRIFEDDETIIFLSKYPTLPGYCLVCPREHREDLAQDMSTDEYLRLQEKVHVLSRALKSVFDAERIYVLSLGSQQANSHLHFHVVPLPSGVPLEEQQYHALMAEHGVLQMSHGEMVEMARQIAEAYHAEGANRC
ncbi:HIT family protein [Rhizobium bangladeshense]|uniref:HIT family protein n=1 Tax=Rhizobium bangladeshense TaxID=1138189 RepID=UPI0007E57434|nr:HIT family protein [Rhizobium bangladeshense]